MARLILFGATGDLARGKLFPALSAIGGEVDIVAIGRRDYTQEEFLNNHVPHDPKLRQRITYRKMDFTDPTGYKGLFDPSGGNLAYFSVDPQAVLGIANQLGCLELPKRASSLLVVLEKPFGQDAESAKELDTQLKRQFSPEQLLRVDHYLLKEGVELVISLARQNPSLACAEITSLTVRIMEQEGVGTRGAFYSNTGAIKDVVQNHLLNVASVVACGSVSAKWLRSLTIIGAQFGQYQGFTEEVAVVKDSNAETFARVALTSDTLSLTLETGKGLERQYADIHYKTAKGADVVISLQPTVSFTVSQHGDEVNYELPGPKADAYERLFECLLNDPLATTVLDSEAIQAAWEIADQLATLKATQPLLIYPRGGSGPR